MRIDAKSLEDLDFVVHISEQEGIVEIYPRNSKDISKDLQVLTQLSRRNCFQLMDEIHELQVWEAVKKTS